MATLRQKIRLLRGVIDGEVAFGGPLYADVDVTRRCNLSCLGCQYHSSRTRNVASSDPTVRNVPFEQIEQLCTELPALGTGEVLLVGEGEPLLHPRACDIVSAFKAAGCKVQLFTNGTLIDQGRARALLESGLDVLRVSLWASSVDEYRLCYPGVDLDLFDRALQGVRTVTELKAQRGAELPAVIVTQPLNRHNCGSISKRLRLAHELGCDGVGFDTYRHWGDEFASVALSAEQIQGVCQDLRRARKVAESLSLEHNIDRMLLKYRLGETGWRDTLCYAGWFFTRIRVDGMVVPCGACSTPMGNVRDAGFGEIWNGPEYRAFRRQASSPGGLASLSRRCDCNWCCLAADSALVHRYARWVAFLRGGKGV
jgi:MoaA/NifB/PqqE/SkfB family radical SAM enzyme